MHNKRPLVPRWLNRLDEKLLKNHPETWTTRTHLVLYYGVLFILALAGLCFIVPDDPRTATGVVNWVMLVIMVAIVAFVVWMMYLLRFNVFKRYGNTTALSRLKVFVLYGVCIGTMVFAAYVPSIVETTRANMAYGDEEVVKDINAVNMAVAQLEYDSLNHRWHRDTLLVVDTLPGAYRMTAPAPPVAYETTDTVTIVQPGRLRKIDTAQLNRQLAARDSIVRLNDSIYIFLESPKYTFVLPYPRPDEHTKEKMYVNKDVYEKVIRNYHPSQQTEALKAIQELQVKYDIHDEHTYRYYDRTSVPERDYFQRVQNRYSLYDIQASFNNILHRKYRFDDVSLSILLRSFIYVILAFTLLVFVFRHTTTRAFFLSLLVAVLLMVFTGLLMAFSGYSPGSLQAWCIFYCILFFAVSLLALKPRSRNVVVGIGLNLFVIMIWLLPLLIVSYYYHSLEQRYTGYPTPPIDYVAKSRHILYAEIGGVLLLLALIPTLIHHLYRKWFAAPEE